jgi:hypothetical protein
MPLGFGKAIFTQATAGGGGGGGDEFITAVFQSQSDTTVTVGNDIKYDDNKVNTDSFITVSGTNDSFTITETGRYYINGSVTFVLGSGPRDAGEVDLLMKNNGTTIARGVAQHIFFSGDIKVTALAQGYFDLTANDVITFDTANTGYSTVLQDSSDVFKSNLVILKIVDTDEIHLSRSTAQTLDYGTSFGGGANDSRYFKTKTLEWDSEVTKETGYTHSNTTDPEMVTLSDAGTYFVSANIDMTAINLTGSTIATSVMRVVCEDTNYGGGGAGSGTYGDTGIVSGMTVYTDGSPVKHGDHNLFGLIKTSEANVDVKIVIDSHSIADSTRVMDYSINTGSFFKICKVPAGADIFMGTNSNRLIYDSLDPTDRSMYLNKEITKGASYTHDNSTSNEQITCASGNRYLIMGSSYYRVGIETVGSGIQFQRMEWKIRDVTNSADVLTNQGLHGMRFTILIAGGFNYQDDDLGDIEESPSGGIASRGGDGMELVGRNFLGITDSLTSDTTFDVRYKMIAEQSGTAGHTDPSDDPNYNVKNNTGSTVDGIADGDFGFGAYEYGTGVMIIKLPA